MGENETSGARAGETGPAAVRYTLDAAKSTFTVQAFAGGLLSGFGHDPTIAIREFEGEAGFVPGTLEGAWARVAVKARSLEVIDDIKEKDKREMQQTMLAEVLEVGAHPEILFRSTSVTPTRVAGDRVTARIVGEVTLHGVTRGGLWIMAQLETAGDDVRARGDFTLKQTDFGIKLVSVAGGALKLKDELKFTFDLAGHKAAGD